MLVFVYVRVLVFKNDKQVYSPDMEPSDSLAATRFTIGDFDVSCNISSQLDVKGDNN